MSIQPALQMPFVCTFLLFCLTGPLHSQAQRTPSGQEPTIRVSVGLVQTDVMVFDKQGHFVPDLKKEQFELRIDGKVQPIEFFEMISAGSRHDEEIWARAENKPVQIPEQHATKFENPGRTLLFFVDDWHLSADSTMRCRAALSNLINVSVEPRDRAAIFAASGQLGSTQQLTGDKAMLLASLEKLSFKSAGAEDLAWPPMTEAQAAALDRNDKAVLTYFVSAILRKPVDLGMIIPGDGGPLKEAVETTLRRASFLVQQSAGLGERSLGALRSFLQSVETLPGRKIVFYLSDGFVLQTKSSDVVSRINEITTGAARAGIVVYTLDARGLVVGLPDSKVKRAPDITGSLAGSGVNEVAASMDALNAIASDTGGRFLKNTNALDAAMITTLEEISRYYLLGWAIDPEKLQAGKNSTIRVAIKGGSSLNVRVRQGSLDLSKLVQGKK
ncbi:MAG: VWA domain-containing protein [Acidobacteriia bacterium]|nr:VWA domain-containing protein [Terriglobia bacterium]